MQNATLWFCPSTPARTGQTTAPQEGFALLAFNPCTYRADKAFESYDFGKGLQPLHVQGRH